jgi:pantetheine-phosphate adenylyltransferase
VSKQAALAEGKRGRPAGCDEGVTPPTPRSHFARPGNTFQPKNAVASAAWVGFDPSPLPMRHCIYPGTFDPITYGHLDVLSRAAKLFDRVTVAVAESGGKAPLFTPAERLQMIAPNVANLPHVSVTTFSGLLVEFCMSHQADAIIRGLRALSDFEFEFNMALMNRHLEPELETLFVMPNEQFSYTSSTLVKQVAAYGGNVGHFVPPNVAEALTAAYRKGKLG